MSQFFLWNLLFESICEEQVETFVILTKIGLNLCPIHKNISNKIPFCSIFTQQFLIRIIDLQYDFMSFFKSKNITFKSLTSFFVPLLEGSSSLRYFNGIVISLKIVWSSTPPLQSSTRGFLEGGVVKDSALLDN